MLQINIKFFVWNRLGQQAPAIFPFPSHRDCFVAILSATIIGAVSWYQSSVRLNKAWNDPLVLKLVFTKPNKLVLLSGWQRHCFFFVNSFPHLKFILRFVLFWLRRSCKGPFRAFTVKISMWIQCKFIFWIAAYATRFCEGICNGHTVGLVFQEIMFILSHAQWDQRNSPLYFRFTNKCHV